MQDHERLDPALYEITRCGLFGHPFRRVGLKIIRKILNMTLDGFCDHTAVIAYDELHQHNNEVLSNKQGKTYWLAATLINLRLIKTK